MSGQIEELLQKVQALEQPQARETALGLAQAILDLHAAALARMLELVSESGDGPALIDKIAADPQAGSVLLLHDLHPLDLAARVERALEDKSFHGRGATVELVSVQDGVVRVRIEGGPALHSAVERAIWEAAPDARELIVDGAPDRVSSAGFVPIEQLLAG
ncbi:MAG TPA: hypothetical protein VMH05_07605 [Bryobacteraceae bacterium]|nr:hypothetical protein [Bryobacteraceae bacterium]